MLHQRWLRLPSLTPYPSVSLLALLTLEDFSRVKRSDQALWRAPEEVPHHSLVCEPGIPMFWVKYYRPHEERGELSPRHPGCVSLMKNSCELLQDRELERYMGVPSWGHGCVLGEKGCGWRARLWPGEAGRAGSGL